MAQVIQGQGFERAHYIRECDRTASPPPPRGKPPAVSNTRKALKKASSHQSRSFNTQHTKSEALPADITLGTGNLGLQTLKDPKRLTSDPKSPPWSQVEPTRHGGFNPIHINTLSLRPKSLRTHSSSWADNDDAETPEENNGNRGDGHDGGEESDTPDMGLSLKDQLRVSFNPVTVQSLLAGVARLPVKVNIQFGAIPGLHVAESVRQHTNGSSGRTRSSTTRSGKDTTATTPATSGTTPSRTRRTLDPGDEDANEDDEDEETRKPMKKRKVSTKVTVRWDCPLSRQPTQSSGDVRGNPGCARKGLEFRHLWYVRHGPVLFLFCANSSLRGHFMKVHYGCEKCGLKLSDSYAEKEHYNKREKDANVCRPHPNTQPAYPIGMDLYLQMEKIYRDPDKMYPSQQEKWAEWWKLLFPEHTSVPDGIHLGTIQFAAADMPELRDCFRRGWNSKVVEKKLPALDEAQLLESQNLFEDTFRQYIYQCARHPEASNQLSQNISMAEYEPDFDAETVQGVWTGMQGNIDWDQSAGPWNHGMLNDE